MGVPSIDKFVDQGTDVIERFARLTEEIERKRNAIDNVTGFVAYKKEGAKLRHAFLGVILEIYSLSNGDTSKVKIVTNAKKPLIKITLNGVTGNDVEKHIKAFEDYIDEITDCVEVKMP